MEHEDALERANSIADTIEASLEQTELTSIEIAQLQRREGRDKVTIIAHLTSFSAQDKKQNPEALEELKQAGETHPTVNSRSALLDQAGSLQMHFEIPLANWKR